MKFVSTEEVCEVSRKARDLGLLEREDTSAIFISRDVIDDRLNRLQAAFPDGTHHAISIKTNPLQAVLKHIVSRGYGLEAASMSELRMAVAAGVELSKLVFDSPAKTKTEISCLESSFQGSRVNADSIEELSRYSTNTGLRLGLRINPLFASNAQSSMNVGGAYSKFGEAISNREKIIRTCADHPEIDCLHLHIGSQAADYAPNVRAIVEIVKLAKGVNETAGLRKIKAIDIGGGFPVNYGQGAPYEISDYANAIREACPELWSGEFSVITEYGRYIHANAAWCLTDIEYVKEMPEGRTITVQVGADMFLRECYHPAQWPHKMFVIDDDLTPKDGPAKETRIGGPLCFGGDYVGVPQDLPDCCAGDKLVIQDVGANSFSLWSRHCSRPFPKVITYSLEGADLTIAKARETEESIVEWWS